MEEPKEEEPKEEGVEAEGAKRGGVFEVQGSRGYRGEAIMVESHEEKGRERETCRLFDPSRDGRT